MLRAIISIMEFYEHECSSHKLCGGRSDTVEFCYKSLPPILKWVHFSNWCWCPSTKIKSATNFNDTSETWTLDPDIRSFSQREKHYLSEHSRLFGKTSKTSCALFFVLIMPFHGILHANLKTTMPCCLRVAVII